MILVNAMADSQARVAQERAVLTQLEELAADAVARKLLDPSDLN